MNTWSNQNPSNASHCVPQRRCCQCPASPLLATPCIILPVHVNLCISPNNSQSLSAGTLYGCGWLCDCGRMGGEGVAGGDDAKGGTGGVGVPLSSPCDARVLTVDERLRGRRMEPARVRSVLKAELGELVLGARSRFCTVRRRSMYRWPCSWETCERRDCMRLIWTLVDAQGGSKGRLTATPPSSMLKPKPREGSRVKPVDTVC